MSSLKGKLANLGKVAPTPAEIATLPLASVTDDEILKSKDRVLKQYQALGASDQAAKGVDLVGALKKDLVTRFPTAVPLPSPTS
jgi:hypothetical protein